MSAEQPSSDRTGDAPRRGPLVVGIVGPPEGTSLLTVVLTTGLRGRGYRVGTTESRTTIEGRAATVLTLGNGARVTLEGDLTAEALADRAATLDPTLDVLLALDRRTTDVVELTAEGASPRTEESRLLAAIPAARLDRAYAEFGPAADLGIIDVIAARLALTTPGAERTLERPIETERRRLPARPPEHTPDAGAHERVPRRSLLDRLRRKPEDRGN